MFYIGLGLFAISLFMVLSRQFVQIFYDLQNLNSKIIVANAELEKRNNEIISTNQDLNKINYEWNAFVNNTSQNLQAPLIALLRLVHEAKNQNDVNFLEEYFSKQEKTLFRMNKLIEDIINFSKNKRLVIDLEEIDFKKIVSDSLEDDAYFIAARGIKKMWKLSNMKGLFRIPGNKHNSG